MTEFVDNNVISSLIKQSTFFLNKNFHSRISFDSNLIEYEITRAKIETDKAKDIFEHIKRSLTLTKQTLTRFRITMKKQTDKHRKKTIYKINDIMFLNFKNITIVKSLKKLNDKMLKSFKILLRTQDHNRH